MLCGARPGEACGECDVYLSFGLKNDQKDVFAVYFIQFYSLIGVNSFPHQGKFEFFSCHRIK